MHTVDIDDAVALEKFLSEPFVSLDDETLIVETKASLIHMFRPAYNTILYDNYPNIANGMRTKGYTYTDLVIERLPAILSTDHARSEAVEPI